ncbi:uncharacterized protein F4822DRAFT_444927 [Hypoxylon trugodes]|uniref:uncharacterized protein n=1 Tax=Hypoxylon trugodes TaxID=326681 RepID=UPI00218EC51E|nr:uncharacterized protein F4822DRAFT_444927 [Hypoxylon trugodes]KAI1386562.1 hypothetical protein F4822DRAFT_444927 [Hypoxylon trugodes]
MCKHELSTTSPAQGPIKVYATPDGTIENWTNPRRIHLHKTTPYGTVQCCDSVTAGGIVEDSNENLYFLTSDQFIPEDADQRDLHTNTNDATCAPIGHVKHTSRNLRYTLIIVNDCVADEVTTKKALGSCGISVSGQMSFKAALHPLLIKKRQRESDMLVLARTRHNEVIKGNITFFPPGNIAPWKQGAAKLMTARFDPSYLLGKLEVGAWVYAIRPEALKTKNWITCALNDEYFGPFEEEKIFQYFPFDHPRHNSPDTLILVGHVVEVRSRGADNSEPVEVGIQGAYEVLTEIFVHRGTLNNPSGVPTERPALGPMPSSSRIEGETEA